MRNRNKKSIREKIDYSRLTNEILNKLQYQQCQQKKSHSWFTVMPIVISIIAIMFSGMNYYEIHKSNTPFFVVEQGTNDIDDFAENNLDKQFGLKRIELLKNNGGKVNFIGGDLMFYMMIVYKDKSVYVPYNLSANRDVYYDYKSNYINFRYYGRKGDIVVNNLLYNFFPRIYKSNRESPGEVSIGILKFAYIYYKDYYGKEYKKYYKIDDINNRITEIDKKDIPNSTSNLEWNKFMDTKQIYEEICKMFKFKKVEFSNYIDEGKALSK